MSFVSKTQKENNEKENKKVKFKNCDINKKQNDNNQKQEIECKIEDEKENKADKNIINNLKIKTENINNLKNKLKLRLKTFQKKYNTENNKSKNIIKSELIAQKVKILEQNISQYQTEKNKYVEKKKIFSKTSG